MMQAPRVKPNDGYFFSMIRRKIAVAMPARMSVIGNSMI